MKSVLYHHWCNCLGLIQYSEFPNLKIFYYLLKYNSEKNIIVEANKGYIGEYPEMTMPPVALYLHDEKYMKMKAKVTFCHKTINKRLNQYRYLIHYFHYGIKKHTTAFQAVAVLIQLANEFVCLRWTMTIILMNRK